MKSSPSDRKILAFMTGFARHYLNSGGPTSRLEDSLIRVGALYDHETEVFATPTGIFITLNDPSTSDDPTTALARIRETGTNLGQLCLLENLLSDLKSGLVSLDEAVKLVSNPLPAPNHYSTLITGLAAFFAGFVASFMNYQQLVAAVGSGLISAALWYLTSRIIKRKISNPIFSDFLGAFLTLVLAALAHGFVRPLSIEAYAIGGIVLLVPGLALTTAIAELAEQNLVSGTAKFMQAAMGLLAMGLAYVLFQQISFSLQLSSVLQPVAPRMSNQWLSALAVIVNITCFGVIFRVPPKMLIWSALTGLSGWTALGMLRETGAAAAGPFLGSVMVGIVSLAFGKIFRLPSQVFSVPGIIAMLPGIMALTSFRYFAAGDQDLGLAFTFQVAVTAVSIVFGLMTARIPFTVAEGFQRK